MNSEQEKKEALQTAEVIETEVFRLKGGQSDRVLLRKAGATLRAGGLVAFPTETVYGLGGDALNPSSSRKIYAAKGRPSDNPLIVHICRMEDLAPITEEIPPAAEKLAGAFWPGPLTMIFRKSGLVPYETTGGLDTVAVRMPVHPAALAFIEEAGGYVAAPSANRSGRPSPTCAKYVVEDMMGQIELILDGGDVEIGLESTIVDMTVSPPMILRPGYITKDMLEEVVGPVETDRTILTTEDGQAPKAPGMKYRHYAPKGELVIVDGEEEQVVKYINEQLERAWKDRKITGVIGTDETIARYRGDVCLSVGKRSDEAVIARRLYRILREFDREEVSVIFSESFDTAGIGQAIMNRLLKAAGHKIIYLEKEETEEEQ